MLFYYHNCRISSERHSCNSKVSCITPIEAHFTSEEPFTELVNKHSFYTSRSTPEASESVGENTSSDADMTADECISSVCAKSVAGAILNESLNLFRNYPKHRKEK